MRSLRGCLFVSVRAAPMTIPKRGGGEIVPSVKIENPSVSENSVTFTIVPENAESCAYVYYAESAKAQSAEQILASGTPVDAGKSSTVTISDLEYDTKYYFVAAVKSTTGNVAVASVDQTTSGKPVTDLGDPANTYMVSGRAITSSLRRRSPAGRSMGSFPPTGSGRPRAMRRIPSSSLSATFRMPTGKSASRPPAIAEMPPSWRSMPRRMSCGSG